MPSCSLCSLQVEPIFIWHDYICIYGASFSLFAFVTKWSYGLARLYNFNDIAIQCHTNWDTLIRMQTVHLLTQKCFMPGSTKTRMMHFYRSSGSKKVDMITWQRKKVPSARIEPRTPSSATRDAGRAINCTAVAHSAGFANEPFVCMTFLSQLHLFSGKLSACGSGQVSKRTRSVRFQYVTWILATPWHTTWWQP